MSNNRLVRNHSEKPTGVPGLGFPGFIQNGSYYLTELQIFGDGLTECWGGVDLDFLARKFEEGWIAASVPLGEEISIHDVIQGQIVSGQWSHDSRSLHQRLLDAMAQLNPTRSRLVDFEEDDVEVLDGHRYAKGGRIECSARRKGPAESPAETSRYSLVRERGQIYLTNLRIYADGLIDVHPRLGEERLIDLQEFEVAVLSGEIPVSVPDRTLIEIDSLGRFEMTDVYRSVERPQDLIDEVRDEIAQLNGRDGLIIQCRKAFQAYLDHPTLATRDLLKAAYESIPEHYRSYVGGQDTKDYAVRMILYGEQEMEGWSHRMVSRSMGDEVLPMIEVPKPIDEDE